MKQVSRRCLIRNTSVVGIAICLGISEKGLVGKTLNMNEAKNFTPYILVDSAGGIIIYNTKPEMGQGTFQSIPALIAEEFEVSLDQITIKLTRGEKEFGNGQHAGGSSSVRTSYTDLRKKGASANEVFVQAASQKWGIEVSTCCAENGKVIHKPTNRIFTYGELVEEASKLELPKEPNLKDPKDFKILGKEGHRPDVPLKTCGNAEFGIDVQVPGILYASVERNAP